MWSLFKKSVAKTATSVARLSSLGRASDGSRELDDRRLLRPLALPEVVEGNSDADWALWEDSVAFQESGPLHDTVPSALDAPAGEPSYPPPTPPDVVDVFASVHKKSS